MKEDINFELSRLCYLLEKRRLAELAYSRANYRVSYYRKIKARLDSKNPKNKSTHLELAKKIEAARLTALKRHEESLEVKEKTKKSVNSILKKIGGQLVFANGKVIGIQIIVDYQNRYSVPVGTFADKAADYEATIAMNRLLSSK